MSTPSFLGAGTPGHVLAYLSPTTPTYPTGISSGDLCLLQLSHQDSPQLIGTTVVAPNSTDGWELIASSSINNYRGFLYGKICNGTEGGGTTSCGFVSTSSNTQLESVITAFTGLTTSSTTVASVQEATATMLRGSSWTVFAPTVITVNANRLAVAVCFDDSAASGTVAFPDFTGETGGTWATIKSSTDNTVRPHLFVQDCLLTSSESTLTGGTTRNSTTTSGSWITFGLALMGASTASVGSPIFFGSIFDSGIFGQGIVA